MSIVDQGLIVRGDISGEDDLTVKGVIKGTIVLQKGHLNIDQSGYVEGEILADKVVVAGEILGNIIAINSLYLLSTSKVLGNLQAGKFAMADGASFSGKLEVREPEPVELGIQDFETLSEKDYEKLRRWRLRNKVE
jgi:cytoskeletal protein CcmA (bactofilin family)